jgi:arginyl-tRNA synthetase
LWNKGKEAPHLRFVMENDRELTTSRMALVQGVAGVIAVGLALLGVSAPDEMR